MTNAETTALIPRAALRSRSVRNRAPTLPRVSACWMRASAKADMRAPASVCVTDARPRKAWPSPRSVRPAGRHRSALACRRRGPCRTRARPPRRRLVVPRTRRRRRADARGAGRSRGARPRRGDPARRRAVLRALRLLGRQDGARWRCPARSSATACSALELRDGALDGAAGLIVATGAAAKPARAERRASSSRGVRTRSDAISCSSPRPRHRVSARPAAEGHRRWCCAVFVLKVAVDAVTAPLAQSRAHRGLPAARLTRSTVHYLRPSSGLICPDQTRHWLPRQSSPHSQVPPRCRVA